MKIIGIIAEYNPFHNGHAYQIAEIRKKTGADYIIIAMSGDFVQRGAPAIIDKYARTKMALACGADLVLELPALWATASAERFATAGVTLFDKMGCVDGLCFGAETDNLPLLMQLADILAKEPDAYKNALSSYIKEGLNFPTARAQAMCDLFAQDTVSTDKYHSAAVSSRTNSLVPTTLAEVLSNPNNILALEYLKALKQRGSSIKPLLLKREGAGYHEETVLLSASAALECNAFPTASATAIRCILTEQQISHSVSAAPFSNRNCNTKGEGAALSHLLPSLKNAMPPAALSVLTDYLAANPILQADDLSPILSYLLLTSQPGELARIGDCNADIANRIYGNRMFFRSFTQFCELNKSRDITYTRMSRILLHAILKITDDDYSFFQAQDTIPYLRVLGFCKASAGLFKEIKAHANIPLITKLADADKILAPNALRLLQKDIFAADLYEQNKALKTGSAIVSEEATQKRTTPRSEYTRGIVRI